MPNKTNPAYAVNRAADLRKETKEMMRLTGILIVMMLCNSCSAGYNPQKVHEASDTLPDLPKIDVAKPDRFLNDLMLSPLWKVEKERDGSFIAKARSIGQDWPSDGDGSFLFEFIANPNSKLPKDYRMHNRYLDGDKTFSSFRITVVFQKPDLERASLGESGQKVIIQYMNPSRVRLARTHPLISQSGSAPNTRSM